MIRSILQADPHARNPIKNVQFNKFLIRNNLVYVILTTSSSSKGMLSGSKI